MCEPIGITLAGVMTAVKIAGAIAAVASTAISIPAAVQQGKSQEAMYNYQAKVNQENAKIAQENANVQRQQGIEEARLQRIKAASTIGSQKTAMAANGVDVTQGTAVDVIADTAAIGELDALQTQYNYEMKARGYEAQAGNFQNQANLDVISGKNAYTAGKIGAVQAGLGGLTQVGDISSKWFDFGSGSTNTKNKKIGKNVYSGGIVGDHYLYA